MAPAVYETTSVKIGAGSHLFTTSASKLDFEGFMSVYVEADDEEEKNQVLGNLEKGTVLKLEQLDPSQHFTQPPAHYTEASLVKALEEQGIGRQMCIRDRSGEDNRQEGKILRGGPSGPAGP